MSEQQRSDIEVSVVMPCLNEAYTVAICVRKARDTLEKMGVNGEVIVVDNGSTDDSPKLAAEAGAQVFHESKKGYGNAYMKGFREAKGKFIVMGDADDSYDFTDLERFIQPLREGYDMVMGTRLKGEIKKNAMPWLHRYFGVPVLTWMLDLLYGLRISDAHCGMRSFTRAGFERMHLETTGMEFASEMIIKAAYANLKIYEIPIILHLDGRPGKPHLRSFSDGWRHITFMLNYRPGALYFLPGWGLMIFGVLGLLGSTFYYLVNPSGGTIPVYWALMTGFSIVTGYQLLIAGVMGHVQAYRGYFPRPEKFIKKFYQKFDTLNSILCGVYLALIGLLLVILTWGYSGADQIGFITMGFTILAVGLTTIFNSFLLGQMNIRNAEC